MLKLCVAGAAGRMGVAIIKEATAKGTKSSEPSKHPSSPA